MSTIDTNPQPGLVKEVICPNCWERFPPERTWYVSTDAALYGDPRLGSQERRRFLPTSFHPDGRALGGWAAGVPAGTGSLGLRSQPLDPLILMLEAKASVGDGELHPGLWLGVELVRPEPAPFSIEPD